MPPPWSVLCHPGGPPLFLASRAHESLALCHLDIIANFRAQCGGHSQTLALSDLHGETTDGQLGEQGQAWPRWLSQAQEAGCVFIYNSF